MPTRANTYSVPENIKKTSKRMSFFVFILVGADGLRLPAGKPRRLQQSTGLLPRAAFRIHFCILQKCSHIYFLQQIKKTFFRTSFFIFWWERMDSNHRSHWQQIYSLPPLATREHSHKKMELVDGLEPPTCWLQISCSTDWATPAYVIKFLRYPLALNYNNTPYSKCQHFF